MKKPCSKTLLHTQKMLIINFPLTFSTDAVLRRLLKRVRNNACVDTSEGFTVLSIFVNCSHSCIFSAMQNTNFIVIKVTSYTAIFAAFCCSFPDIRPRSSFPSLRFQTFVSRPSFPLYTTIIVRNPQSTIGNYLGQAFVSRLSFLAWRLCSSTST